MAGFNILIKKFPIELAFPKRILVENREQFYKIVNNENGIHRIWYSLYPCDSLIPPRHRNCRIDKIWFDLDSKNAFENIKKIHSETKLKHLMVFSGGGFHIYFFTKNYDGLKNAKATLTAIHRDLAKKFGLTIGKPDVADIDEHVVGDIARVVTVINSWNNKRKRYAIPLSDEDLNLGLTYIKEKAKKQNFEPYNFYGEEFIDVSEYDKLPEKQIEIPEVSGIFGYNGENAELKNFPPCVQSCLREDAGWRHRGLAILYFRELGFSEESTRKILKKYLSPQKYNHCVNEEKQISYLYKRQDLFFPKCEKLYEEGLCSGKCEWYKKLYKETENR